MQSKHCFSIGIKNALKVILYFFFLLKRDEALGKTIFIVFTLSMSILTLFATIWFEFKPTIDIIFATGTELYNSPLARISPYFPGVVAGALYSKYKNNPGEVLVSRFDTLC
jgi:hypothetical protein